jgi:hypothetical protein
MRGSTAHIFKRSKVKLTSAVYKRKTSQNIAPFIR